MYPAYRYMDSYPHGPHPHSHQRDSIPPPYYQYPSWEAISPHVRVESQNTPYMRVESPKPPAAWGPGNYYGNVGHHHPADCSGCCIHSYPHGQSSFRPQYPQAQPIPQSYYGPYGYHEPYPYFVPPTPYSVDQARYDYDKPRSHCCSCPEHSRMNGGVRVEEHNPDGEKQDDNVTSLIRMPGNASPIVWVPSGNVKGKEEHKKPEPQSAVWFPNHPSQVWVPSNFMGEEENKNSEAQPAVSNAWIPLDIGGLKELMRAANEKKSSSADGNKNKLEIGSIEDLIRAANDKKNPPVKENKQDIKGLEDLIRAANGKKNPTVDENKNKLDIESLKELIRAANEANKPSPVESQNQFPWPIIWVPGDNEKDGTKDVKDNASSKVAEEVLPKLKIIPMKLLDERGEKPETEEQKGQGSQEKASGRETKLKIIPVKQIEEDEKGPVVDGKHQENEKGQKAKSLDSNQGENGKKTSDSKQSGQAKTSKLPPVCLRVDPLPKKNNKSRSPSPPSHKVEQQQSLREKKDETNTKEIRVVDMNVEKQKHCSQDVTVVTPAKADNHQESKELYAKTLEDSKGETKDEVQKTEERRDLNESKISEKRSKILSPDDAAVLIQSAFRGYGVRRWQPLEKLKRIAEIQKQANAITEQLQALEQASDALDKKQIVVMNENIMRLLLQLDTIQGLQQDVREVRKHVARELICVQEKLDAVSRLASKEPEKTQATISDGSSTSDALVSGITSSSATTSEDNKKSMKQVPDSLEMEHEVHNLTSEGNAALDGQAEMTIREVPVLAEEDGALPGAKKVNETSILTTGEVYLLNDNKAYGSLDQNDVSSIQAEPSDYDLSKAEELELKDSTQEEQPLIVKEQSDSDVSRAPEVDMAIEELVSDQNDLEKEPEQVVHVEEAKSENVASILEDHQENQYSNFQLGQAKTEPLVADNGLNKLSEPTSPNDIAYAALPAVESEVDVAVADSSDVLSSLAESLPPVEVPNADSAVEKSELIEVSRGLPNDQFGNGKYPHEENESLEANGTRIDIAIKDGSTEVDTVVAEPLPPAEEPNADIEIVPSAEEPNADTELVSSAVEKSELIEVSRVLPNDQFRNGEYPHKENASIEANETGTDIARKDESMLVEDCNMLDKPIQVQIADDPVMESTYSDPEIIKPTQQENVEAVVRSDAAMAKKELVDRNDKDEAKDNAAGIPREELVAHTDGLMDFKGFAPINEVEDVINTESIDQKEIKGTHSIEQTSGLSKEEMKLVEENEKLREMLERLLEAGKTQLGVIADLNGRVKDLEKKLSQKKRLRSKKQKLARSATCKVA